MKTILIICFTFLGLGTLTAQEMTGTIENHPKKDMDVVLMLFGMDNPISVGTVDKNGQFTVDLERVKDMEISEETKSMFFGELAYSFFFSCGGPADFGEIGEKPAVRQDFLRLNQNDQWSGTVFLVTDENLIPWIEDSGYNNAIKGSFLEIIYVEEDIDIKMTCGNQIYASDEEMVDVSYDFDLNLKKGFNWVEYEILEVFETNPEVRASFPSKVRIQNMKNPAEVKWIGTYY